jgi:hypothetical protein
MERLTERDANCADPKEIYGVRVKNHDYISAANRLAAYEDTGLTPEQCENAKTIIESAFSDDTSKVERIRELLKADRDGRLVVLPCKVGDTLWVTGHDNVPREMELEAPDIRAVCTDEDNLCMSTCNRKPDGFCAYRLRNDGADVGKTVFLTHEEAEKALEAKKDE